jgi:peptidyl-prolyl cis-trans isomerase A (cyclophilin A)
MNKFLTFALLLMLTLSVNATQVRFETNLGNIDIELFEDEAPITVTNFLNYVNNSDYDGTIIHRITKKGDNVQEPNNGIRVIQGGGFSYSGNGVFVEQPVNSPIILEAGISNTSGTIAMARFTDPNSATNQWFINVVDNTNLNPSSGFDGYAVFGKVINGMEVVNLISSLQRVDFRESNLGDNLTLFPVYNFDGVTFTSNFYNDLVVNLSDILRENVVTINRAFVLSDTFQINAGLSGAWYNPATDGQGIYIEVLPATGQVIMAWFTFDTEFPDDITPSEVGFAGNRWLVAIGDFNENEFNGTVYQTSNGKFDDPAPVTNEVVGTVSITFNSCGELVMSYSLYEGTLNGMNNLQKISGANIELCEQLASEANQGVAAQ